jgi:MFS family permease
MVDLSKLKRNFSLMFWIQALLETKVLNAVVSIFLVFRGLTLAQIFYLAVIFSVVTFLSELPSSYLADKWGRKNMIVVAVGLNLIYGIICIFGQGFWPFAVAFAIFALSTGLFSGTDEALVYDTSKNLGEEGNSLKKLGQYFSAQRIFKIVTPIMAVLIAKDLNNRQFIYLLSIDNLALFGAFVLGFFLIEPKIHYQKEKVKSGILKDAWNLMKGGSGMVQIVISKTLIFTASFLIWRIYSEYFRQLNVTVLLIGIITSVYQLITFMGNLWAHKLWLGVKLERRINWLNYSFTFFTGIFFINEVLWKNFWLAVVPFIFLIVSESLRGPLYSQKINLMTQSYNRATTISLVNLWNSALQVPLIILGSVLIEHGYSFLFGLSLLMALISVSFFRL